MTKIPIQPEAQQWLQQALGTQATFRDGQLEAISALVENRTRVLVVQRTGWGKSLVYFLTTRLLRNRGAGATILISPLLSLMRNQIAMAQSFGLNAATINSSNHDEHTQIEQDLIQGKIDILLISPERLANKHFQDVVWSEIRHKIGMLVIDEAHCISDWGHDFRPNYRRLMHILEEIPNNTPILGTTATANDRVVEDINEILGRNLRILRGTLTRDSLRLYVFPEARSVANRLILLEHLLKSIQGNGIIYCATTHDCRRVAEWLQYCGYDVKPYYAKVAEEIGEDRIQLEQALLNNSLKALVASVALGMGFDKPDLSFVIHYQYPGSIISYYQQIGRAGRGIDNAHIILMHGYEDENIQNYFIETAFPEPKQVEQVVQLLNDSKGMTRNELQRYVNVRPSILEKIFVHLEIEGILEKRDRTYHILKSNQSPDFQRWSQVTQQRFHELTQMQNFMQHEGCLMQYIATALDDPHAPKRCGKCKNCTGNESKFKPNPNTIEIANRFLRQGDPIIIEPRKQWAYGLEKPFKGRLPSTNQDGLALCHYYDEGWGKMVQAGKFMEKHFADELVESSAELLYDYWANSDIAEIPTWVTCVSSIRRPQLVPSFARRLAQLLKLPFHDVVSQQTENPEQKMMQNSYQQLANVLDNFNITTSILPEPVLLVDDMVDSGWTLTLIGYLLRGNGSGNVYPFVLAKVGAFGN